MASAVPPYACLISNYRWNQFMSYGRHCLDFGDHAIFKTIIREMCVRYKRHAKYVLIPSVAAIKHVADAEGEMHIVSEVYLMDIEREVPIREQMRVFFRQQMTMHLCRDDPTAVALGKTRSSVLWQACTRFLIRLLPDCHKSLYELPPPPLPSLDPTAMLTSRCQVTIKDVGD